MASDVKQTTENSQIKHVLGLIDRVIAEGNQRPNNRVERRFTRNDDWIYPYIITISVENHHASSSEKHLELIFKFHINNITEYGKNSFTGHMDDELYRFLKSDLQVVFAYW